MDIGWVMINGCFICKGIIIEDYFYEFISCII